MNDKYIILAVSHSSTLLSLHEQNASSVLHHHLNQNLGFCELIDDLMLRKYSRTPMSSLISLTSTEI